METVYNLGAFSASLICEIVLKYVLERLNFGSKECTEDLSVQVFLERLASFGH